ncbi:MAG: hypothetical protein WD826_07570 [Actinomycetota bacterium]
MRRAGAVGIALFLLLALAPAAQACSCIKDDPRTSLEKADAAFIGELIDRPQSRSTGQIRSSGEIVDWRFTVEDSVKGDLGDEVVVKSAISGVSCGLSVPLGETVGLFLRRDGGGWRGGLCSQVDPADLRKAAEPLPAPDGAGPARFIVGTDHGDVRAIALDASGRVVLYGYGDGVVTTLDLCPGSRVVLELVRGVNADRWLDSRIARRDVRTMRVIDEVPFRLPERSRETGDIHPRDISCRDPNGRTAILTAAGTDSTEIVVLRLEGEEITTLYDAVARAVSPLHPDQDVFVAAGADGASLVKVDAQSGKSSEIARLVGKTHEIQVNRSGTHLTGKAGQRTLYVADMRTGDIRRGESYGPLTWIDNETFMTVGHTTRIYDLSLNVVDRWADVPPHELVVDGTFYGISEGELQSSTGGAAKTTVIGKLPTHVTYGLVVIPATSVGGAVRNPATPLLVGVVALILLFIAIVLVRRTARPR